MNHLLFSIQSHHHKYRDKPEKSLYIRLPAPFDTYLTNFDFYNRRLKVYLVSAEDIRCKTADDIFEMIEKTGFFSKIIIYTADSAKRGWSDLSFRHEGTIYDFFPDGKDAHLWCRYTDQNRASYMDREFHDHVVQLANKKEVIKTNDTLKDFGRIAAPGDSSAISAILQETFTDYSSEISADLIKKHIATHKSVYRVFEMENGRFSAVVSAELDHGKHSAEITDCATLPAFRGRGVMTRLIHTIVLDVKTRYRITSLYSLVRAGEIGMNCVFRKLGFAFTGRRVNNCHMPTGWESMNIWCKKT